MSICLFLKRVNMSNKSNCISDRTIIRRLKYDGNIKAAEFFEKERLEQLSKVHKKDFNSSLFLNILEYYNYLKYCKDAHIETDLDMVTLLRMFKTLLEKTDFSIIEIDYRYQDDFLALTILTNQIESAMVRKAFDAIHISNLLSYKEIANRRNLKEYIVTRIKRDPRNIEFVLSKAIHGDRYFIPDSDYSDLCIKYIELENPHPDYLKAISKNIGHIKSYVKKIDTNLQTKAAKKYEMMMQSIMSGGTSVQISFLATTSKKEYEDIWQSNRLRNCFPIFIDAEWINNNKKPESILNYLATHEVLFLHDRIFALTSNSNQDSLTDWFGVKSKNRYGNTSFDIKLKSGITFAYAFQSILKKFNYSLEKLAKFYFYSYIPKNYKINFPFYNLPYANYSTMHKTMILCGFVEHILKCWQCYCLHRKFDNTFINFSRDVLKEPNIMSVGNTCYYSVTEKGEKVSKILFLTSYSIWKNKSNGDSYNNLFDYLKTEEEIQIDDECQIVEELKPLVECGILQETDGIIKRHSFYKCGFLYALWHESSINPNHYNEEQKKIINILEKDGLIYKYHGLFTKEEYSFLMYTLNNHGFDNSLGLRNKYMHGKPLYDNDEQYNYDYIMLLLILILLIIKVDDDLNCTLLMNDGHPFYMDTSP